MNGKFQICLARYNTFSRGLAQEASRREGEHNLRFGSKADARNRKCFDSRRHSDSIVRDVHHSGHGRAVSDQVRRLLVDLMGRHLLLHALFE
jgi:hypothetical protein